MKNKEMVSKHHLDPLKGRNDTRKHHIRYLILAVKEISTLVNRIGPSKREMMGGTKSLVPFGEAMNNMFMAHGSISYSDSPIKMQC